MWDNWVLERYAQRYGLMFKFTLESAIEAKNQRRLHQWVIKYLNDEGDNKKLSKILTEEKYIWMDLVKYPLNQLKRVMGPEKGMLFQENLRKWNRRVEHFIRCINKEELLPPIIATDFWNGVHISDGTHRFEALKKTGHKKYWTIFYVKNENNKQGVLSNISKV